MSSQDGINQANLGHTILDSSKMTDAQRQTAQAAFDWVKEQQKKG